MGKADWSKENLEKIVKESYSIADVLRKQGLQAKGGSYSVAWSHIKEHNLDTSHFTGQSWSKSPAYSTEDRKLNSLEEILKENTNYRSANLKQRLVEAGLKEDRCEICGLSEWQGKPIPLELHHINGNHYDNRLENLQVLCINCHAQTDTYRRRKASLNKNNTKQEIPEPISNKHKVKEKVCPICKNTFRPQRNSQTYCSRECSYTASRLAGNKFTESLTKEALEQAIQNANTMTDVAKVLNVSRPTVRKYLDAYGLLDEFKAKFDFRAIPVIQYDMNMNIIKEWPSITDAEQTLGIGDISRCCKFKRKSCGGYIWRYKE